MAMNEQQLLYGKTGEDAMPDFLTCGHCAKEFLLEHITLFVAHKSAGCDVSSHCKGPMYTPVEDTSSPLTCSTCSRVFMTARGLLRHVQEDHKMKICLQKCPLVVPDTYVRPPPAHSSVPGNLYTTRDAHRRCSSSLRKMSMSPSSSSACDENEQPTDLSMTCSNSLGKAIERCNKEEYMISTHPKTKPNITPRNYETTILPKKRRFGFQTSSCGEDFSMCASSCSSFVDSGSCHSDDFSDQSGGPDSDLRTDQSFKEQKSEMDVSVCVTAEYHKEKTLNVCVSSQAPQEKASMLKQLLQDQSWAEQDQASPVLDEGNKRDHAYRFPFAVLPKEGANKFNTGVREQVPNRRSSSDSTFPTQSFAGKHNKRSKPVQLRYTPGSTLEQNIDQLIRASITTDNKTNDFDDLRMAPNSLLSEESLLSSTKSVSTSPNFIATDDQHRFFPQASVDPSVLVESAKHGGRYEATSQKVASEDLRFHPSPVLSRAARFSVPSPLSPRDVDSTKAHFPRNGCLGSVGIPCPQIFDSSYGNHQTYGSPISYSDRDRELTPRIPPTTALCPVDSGFRKDLVNQQSTFVQSSAPCQPMSSLIQQTERYRRTPGQPWVSTQVKDSPDMTRSGTVSRITSSSAYEQKDMRSCHFSAHEVEGEDSKVDMRMKKRRYPTSRPFKCAHCDQAFNQRIHLKKHMSKHTGVKPFQCQQCNYSTVERSHLKVHYRIHTGEKPFKCLYCAYATAQNSTLKIHLMRHHECQVVPHRRRARDSLKQKDVQFSDAYPHSVSNDDRPISGRLADGQSSIPRSSLVETPVIAWDNSQSRRFSSPASGFIVSATRSPITNGPKGYSEPMVSDSHLSHHRSTSPQDALSLQRENNTCKANVAEEVARNCNGIKEEPDITTEATSATDWRRPSISDTPQTASNSPVRKESSTDGDSPSDYSAKNSPGNTPAHAKLETEQSRQNPAESTSSLLAQTAADLSQSQMVATDLSRKQN